MTAALLLSGIAVTGLRSVVADSRPEPRSNLVAVLPFAVRGDSGVQYLGDALVELLATGLDGVGELQTVNPRSVLNVVRGGSRPVEHVDPATAERTAGRLGASQFILGDVTEAGGRLRIRAELYQRGRNEPVADATVEGNRGEVLALADRLVLQLLADVFDAPQTRLNRSAALSTRSLPALRAYLEGERAFRAVEDITGHERAVAAFRRAVDADSTFALAQYRLSVAAWWAGDRALSREAAARAIQLRNRLAPRDQQILTAWHTAKGGDAEAAERLYGDLLLRYPNDAEASFQLGDLLRNTAALRARSRTEALGPLRRALAIDARNGCARCSLLWLELSVGNPASADTLVTGFDPPVSLDQRIVATAAVARGVDSTAQEATLRRLAGVDDGELALSAAWAAAGRGDARFLRRAFELLVAPRRAPDVRALGELLLAQLALMQGQLALADEALRRLEVIDPPIGRAYRALLTAFPFRDPSRSELASLAAALAGDTATRFDPPTGLLPDSALAPLLRGYLRSVVALRSGVPAPLSAPSPVDPEIRVMADFLAVDVAARRALAAGKPEAALAALEQAGRRVPFQPSDLSPLLSFAQTRFLRAELLMRVGREREALAWYRSIGEVPIWDWAYIAPAELRQGEIHERLGERTEAKEHYARVVTLWRAADPSLQPLVRQARLALDRLQAEAER
ncbi:MAG TPA: hypothetical protein VM076_01035 [Gemmatimonadaceae bacterium]|nr:hypothetical protein [Gemmatimonadaceae bacterium]